MACTGQSSEQLLTSARVYLAKNDTGSAIIQLRNSLQSDGNSGEARFLLGKTYLASGDPASASNELRKALDLKYSRTLVVPELARSLNAEGQYSQTIAQFEGTDLAEPLAAADLKTSLSIAHGAQGDNAGRDHALVLALKLAPDFAPALILQARNMAAAGDFTSATSVAERLLKQSTVNPDVWQLKGDLLAVSQSDPAAAIDAYRHALAIKSNLIAAHAGIIEIELARGDSRAAQAQLDALKKASANHPQTRYYEARIALQQHDLKTAGDIAQQLLSKVPDDARVLELSGAVDLQTGAYARAEHSLRAAQQLAPDSARLRRLLAEAQLRNGQAQLAAATLAPLLDRPESDASAMTLAAQIASQSGDGIKAESLLQQALQANPGDANGRTALILAQVAQGRAASATADLQGIAAADPSASADLALIGTALQQKDLDGALRAIDGLERKQPRSPLAATLRGRVLLARQDIAAARHSFEGALSIDPGYFPAADNLAALDVAEGRPDVARRRFDAMVTRDPHRAEAVLALAALAESQGVDNEAVSLYATAVKASPNDVAARLAQIGYLMRKSDVKAALVAAQDAAAALPESDALQHALGRVQTASGDFNQALKTFDREIQQRPKSTAPYLALADVYMTQKDKAQALQSLKRALALDPQSLAVQQKLLTIESSDGPIDDALALARTVQSQRPNEAIGFGFEGDAYSAAKQWPAAVLAYRRGLKVAASPELALKLHAALLAARQVADAERFAIEWTRDHPQDAAFASHLGDAALAEGKLAAAAVDYRAALQASPDNAMAMNNLAWVTFKLGQPGALELAQRANRLQPKQAPFADTLGAILAGSARFDEAIGAQKRAVDLQPDNVSYRMNLARIYLQSGAKGLAKSELQRLATGGGQADSQAEAVRMLGSI